MTVLAIFSEAVSGYDIHHYPADRGEGYVYHLTAWNSIWSRHISKGHAGRIVLNPEGNEVAGVYYYTPSSSRERHFAGDGDILIYGQDQVPEGGVLTLPRTFLAFYFFMAVALVITCAVVLYLFRLHEKVKKTISYILLLALAYILGSLSIKGFYFPSYAAARDLCSILLVAIPLYIVLLSASYLIEEFKGHNLNIADRVRRRGREGHDHGGGLKEAEPCLKGRTVSDLVVGISLIAAELDNGSWGVLCPAGGAAGRLLYIPYAQEVIGEEASCIAGWAVSGGDYVQKAIGFAVLGAAPGAGAGRCRKTRLSFRH